MSGYWLLDWLDNEGIADLSVIEGVLRTPAGYERMLAAADDARGYLPPAPQQGKSMVAGAGLDLSGVLGCGRAACLQRTIEDLVHRSWCYFDRVIVTGLDPNEFVPRASTGDRAFHREMVMNHAAAALHVRDIGAEGFFTFRRKKQLCTDHLNQHAVEAGMPPVDGTVDALTEELMRGYDLSLKETQRGLQYSFRHPMLDTSLNGVMRKRVKKPLLAKRLARQQASRLVAGLTRSVSLSREVHGALGQSTLLGGRLLTIGRPSEPSVPDVALNMRVPAIEGASVEQLLALRQQEPTEFEVFRGALVKTIEERMKALPQDNADRVAQSVVEDVLNPAIAALDLRMQRSARLLGTRSAVALAAGGVLTTVGLIAFAPLTIPGLVLTSGGLVTNYADFLKDRRDVDLSDLHFLWRVGDQLHA